jgi:hypothetical protein
MAYGYWTIVYNHGFRVPEQSVEKLDFGRKSESEVRWVFPEILEEIKGFSEGCHASYEQTAAFVLGLGAFEVGVHVQCLRSGQQF